MLDRDLAAPATRTFFDAAGEGRGQFALIIAGCFEDAVRERLSWLSVDHSRGYRSHADREVSRTVRRTLESAASGRIEPYRTLAFIARIGPDLTLASRRERSRPK